MPFRGSVSDRDRDSDSDSDDLGPLEATKHLDTRLAELIAERFTPQHRRHILSRRAFFGDVIGQMNRDRDSLPIGSDLKRYQLKAARLPLMCNAIKSASVRNTGANVKIHADLGQVVIAITDNVTTEFVFRDDE